MSESSGRVLYNGNSIENLRWIQYSRDTGSSQSAPFLHMPCIRIFVTIIKYAKVSKSFPEENN
ncbi:unnamed protein product, partial [Ceratitis capitata]